MILLRTVPVSHDDSLDCDNCGKTIETDDIFDVQLNDGTEEYRCIDCYDKLWMKEQPR